MLAKNPQLLITHEACGASRGQLKAGTNHSAFTSPQRLQKHRIVLSALQHSQIASCFGVGMSINRYMPYTAHTQLLLGCFKQQPYGPQVHS